MRYGVNKVVGAFLLGLMLLGGAAIPAMSKGRPAGQKNYRLIVSFYSICCGIDGKAKERVDGFLSAYEKRQGKVLSKEVIRWGKEGEVDYCFTLSRLSAKEQNRFIAGIRKEVRGSDRTRVEENAPGKSPRTR